MWKAQPFQRPCEMLTFMTGPCAGHSVTKIPPDLLFGGKAEMDHPLKADVAATRRALSKQHDPPGPVTAKTETDTSRNIHTHTHTIAILHRRSTHTASFNILLQYKNVQTQNGILLAHKNIHGCYSRKDIPRWGAVNKICSAWPTLFIFVSKVRSWRLTDSKLLYRKSHLIVVTNNRRIFWILSGVALHVLRSTCFAIYRKAGRDENCAYNVIKFDTAWSRAHIAVLFFFKPPFPLEIACFVKSLLSRDKKTENMHTNVNLPPLSKWLIWRSGNEAERCVIEPSWIQVDSRKPIIFLWFYLLWFHVFTLIFTPELQLHWNEVFIQHNNRCCGRPAYNFYQAVWG